MAGFIMARQAGWRSLKFPAGDINVWIEGFPADRRRRDADGLLSSMKAALDGIAESLGIDDSRFIPHPRVLPITSKGGKVVVRIEVEAA
jgi:hypothetical protein